MGVCSSVNNSAVALVEEEFLVTQRSYEKSRDQEDYSTMTYTRKQIKVLEKVKYRKNNYMEHRTRKTKILENN